MTDQDLKKLGRIDLLELLLEERKENDRLREELRQTEQQLKKRTEEIACANSIAEAVLRLNGVLEAAEEAAVQYVENVRRIAEEARGNEEKEKQNGDAGHRTARTGAETGEIQTPLSKHTAQYGVYTDYSSGDCDSGCDTVAAGSADLRQFHEPDA